MQKTVRELGINDLLGMQFIITGDTVFTISSVDKKERIATVNWEIEKVKMHTDYKVEEVIDWLNTGIWEPLTPAPTERQTAEALLKEYTDFLFKGEYALQYPIEQQAITDFLTSKYGKG